MPRKEVDRRRVTAQFASIRAAFPDLEMALDTEPGNVDISLEIPRQPGLDFDLFVNLQGDELHLNAGAIFWLEWFPCTDEAVEAAFFDSVHGLLSGRYRIVERYRRGRPLTAELQRPIQGGWKRLATWHRSRLPFGPITRAVLQNRREADRGRTES